MSIDTVNRRSTFRKNGIDPEPWITVDTSCNQHDLKVIILENELLRLEIFPELGGKIYRLIHKLTGTNFLWNNPRLRLRRLRMGANYDVNFFGGWDELFPNDAAGMVEGRKLPDHGELWTAAWSYKIDRKPGIVSLLLVKEKTLVNVRVEKTITLKSGIAKVFFRHRLKNYGKRTARFLWKLHPAMSLTSNHRVDVPGTLAEPVHPEFTRLATMETYRWPFGRTSKGKRLDLRQIPPASDKSREFLYVRGLRAGWCAITDTKRRLGLGIVFPKKVFTSVWLFMTFGGWRKHYTAVLEPCTAYPKDLNEAIRSGNCCTLRAGQVLDVPVTAVIYEGKSRVNSIDSNGMVH